MADIQKLQRTILDHLDYRASRLIVWGAEQPDYQPLVDSLKAWFTPGAHVARAHFDFQELLRLTHEELWEWKDDTLSHLDEMFIYNFDVCGPGVDFYKATDVMCWLRGTNNEHLDQHNLMLARPEANLNYWRPRVSGKPEHPSDNYGFNHPLGNWAIWECVVGDSLEYRSLHTTFPDHIPKIEEK